MCIYTSHTYVYVWLSYLLTLFISFIFTEAAESLLFKLIEKSSIKSPTVEAVKPTINKDSPEADEKLVRKVGRPRIYPITEDKPDPKASVEQSPASTCQPSLTSAKSKTSPGDKMPSRGRGRPPKTPVSPRPVSLEVLEEPIFESKSIGGKGVDEKSVKGQGDDGDSNKSVSVEAAQMMRLAHSYVF